MGKLQSCVSPPKWNMQKKCVGSEKAPKCADGKAECKQCNSGGRTSLIYLACKDGQVCSAWLRADNDNGNEDNPRRGLKRIKPEVNLQEHRH